MDRTTWLGVAAGLLAGLPIGYFLGDRTASPPPPVVESLPAVPLALNQAVSPAPALTPGPPPGPPPGMGGTVGAASAPAAESQHRARIFQNEQIVAKDPMNLQAWIALGNDYFDLHEPGKSVDAYAKALALDSRNPNVLTDQGVMYRALGEFEQAIANFEKASKLDPKHTQSLFNIGIVYAADLKQPKKALDAWNRLLAVNPVGPQADQARAAITALKSKPPPK